MPESPQVTSVTLLGQEVRHPVDHVETFPAPPACALVRLRTEEVSSVCPVTNQPDLSGVTIEYAPHEACVESKSLKLYLWGFRDRPIFAEALAAEIAAEVFTTAAPRWVRVAVVQRPRGGITVEAEACLGDAPQT